MHLNPKCLGRVQYARVTESKAREEERVGSYSLELLQDETMVAVRGRDIQWRGRV